MNVACKIVQHLGGKDAVHWTAGEKGDVVTLATHIHRDEMEMRRQRKAKKRSA